MSNTKTVMGQASNQYVAPVNVEDVFSTYLYEGNGSTQTITNGLDLDGEGGLVWMQVRDVTGGNRLVDSENGNNYLRTHNTSGLTDIGSPAFTLNANGFTVPNGATAWNGSGNDIASWTFRKAPKFFTCLTYSGTGPGSGANEQQVSHDLGAKPGIVIIKRTDATGDWWVFTDVIDGSNDYGYLNQTAAFGNSANNVATDSVFNVGGILNTSGATYVAYLFASNDGDGGFNGGDIIKCGSYTTDGSGNSTIDLGFEPQFVITKKTSGTSDWNIWDTMRGWYNGSNYDYIAANSSAAETGNSNFGNPTATGFTSNGVIGANSTGIYIAIRRGTKVPESASEVFAIDTAAGTSPTPPTFVSGFPVDFSFYKNVTDSSNNWGSQNRLTGDADLAFNTTSAEFINGGTYWEKDYMNGIGSNTGTNSNGYQWMWKRAPGYFDVVAYTGDSNAGRTVSHNLGVAPEMIWVKRRESTGVWGTYHSGVDATSPEDFYLKVESTDARVNDARFWNDTAPDDTVFTLGTHSQVNFSGGDYIAYLFASLPGISKVGSYTGNGTSQTIDCGFTSGARFVLIKRTDSTGGWFTFDTERGIVSGNDPRLKLDSTAAESSADDSIDPNSSGFIVNQASFANVNVNNGSYIFYAIA